MVMLGFPFYACAQALESELLKVDMDFNVLCQEKGMTHSFLAYATDSVIKMMNKQEPIVGKKALSVWLASLKPEPSLNWKPVKAEISSSGDLGYTYGWWRIASADTTVYGNYITIWKKQADGKWKFVFDTGSSTPKPQEINW